MPQLDMLRPASATSWLEVLARCPGHDFFHTPSYHAIAERHGEGEAYLFVFEDAPHLLALPLLLRPVHAVPGLDYLVGNWQDATSVYGYAGPIASHAVLPPSACAGFRDALREALQNLHIVCAFSRLHPLLPQASILDGLGECQTLGPTVSIDLQCSPAEQVRAYRRSLRQEIQKLHDLGVIGREDPERKHLAEFIELYYDAMRRLSASEMYFHDPAYLTELGMHPDTRLFVCDYEDKVIAAGLVTVYQGIMQYHLAGTHRDYLKLSPLKVLIDATRLWAAEQGLRICHLGGGVGAREDNVFLYKAGFSRRRHDFQVWRWVVNPAAYQSLCAAREADNTRLGLRPTSADYFPAYRTPSTTP